MYIYIVYIKLQQGTDKITDGIDPKPYSSVSRHRKKNNLPSIIFYLYI